MTTSSTLRLRGVFVALALTLAGAAQALTITSVSPQGEVSRVRQMVVKFDSAAVRFGDPKAAAPLTVSCDDAEAGKGTGRWTGDREWVFDFARDLPPGVRCTATPKSGFKSPGDSALTNTNTFQFNTGGPYVRDIRPGHYVDIDEEQFFVLRLNGPATLESVKQNVWCVAGDVGERIPVKLIDGKPRQDLLKSQSMERDATASPLNYVTLACNRRLSSGSKMALVFGKGVATPSGVINSDEKRFPTRCASPSAPSSAASVKTRNPAACRFAPCRSSSMRRYRASRRRRFA